MEMPGPPWRKKIGGLVEWVDWKRTKGRVRLFSSGWAWFSGIWR